MASQNEIQFALTLKNDASASLAQFKTDAESAMKAAGTAASNYGKQTQSLTGWIKEQRTEQREHNFLFQQTKEVVQGTSTVLALFGNTIGQSSEVMKSLTGSMNAGFVAFQGVNNVVGLLSGSMSFLAGPWGIVISLAAAAAVAFTQFNSEASKSSDEMRKLVTDANDLDFRLGKVGETARKAFLLTEIIAAQEKVDSLKSSTTDWAKTLAAGGRYGMVTKLVGTPEEISEAENGVRRAEEKFKSFYDATHKTNSDQSAIAKLKQELEALAPGTAAYEQKLLAFTVAQNNYTLAVEKSAAAVSEKLNPSVSRSLTMIGPMSGEIKKIDGAWKATAVTINTQVGSAYDFVKQQQQDTLIQASAAAFSIQNVWGTASSVIRSGFEAAFSGAEGAGTDAIKSLGNAAINLAELYLNVAMAQAFAKGVPTFGTTLAGDFALVAAGTAALEAARAMINRFHEGGTMGSFGQRIPLQSDERPAILRVGETVLPTRSGESGGYGSTTIFSPTVNIMAPGTTKEMVVDALRQFARELGVTTIGNVSFNQRTSLAIT